MDNNKNQTAPGYTEGSGIREPQSEAVYDTEGGAIRKLKKNFNIRYTKIAFYVILTFLIMYLIIKVGDNFGSIMKWAGKALHTLGSILTPLILGFVFAYLLYPVMQFFQRQLCKVPFLKKRKGSNRGLAVAITMIVVAIVLIIVLSIVISAVTHEISLINLDSLKDIVDSITQSLQGIYDNLQKWLEELNIESTALNDVANTIAGFVGSLASGVANWLQNSVGNISGLFSNLVFTVIFVVYFLLDADGLKRYWNKIVYALFGEKVSHIMHVIGEDANYVFSGYIRGQLIDSLIVMVMVSIILSLLNVKLAVIIGILTGIGNLIPYFGPFVLYGCTALVCIVDGDWEKMIIAIIILFIAYTIDGNVINPKLVGSNIDVHPMLVIAAVLIGGAVGGLLGMLLGVPVGALLKMWFDRLVNYLINRRKQKAM